MFRETSSTLQTLQLSNALYDLYGRMRRSEALSVREHQLLQELQAHGPILNDEHHDMLRRIGYRLSQLRSSNRQPSQEFMAPAASRQAVNF